MLIKFIQVNMYKGKYLDALVDFLKREKADIISMQEVTTLENNLYEDKSVNLFELLKQRLGYNGVFHADVVLESNPDAFFGNAVFSKWPIEKSQVVLLKTFRPVTKNEYEKNAGNVWSLLARHMLDATIDLDGFKIHAISVHGRRIAPPSDDPENVRQAQVMAYHLKSLGEQHYVLGGDFNMPPGTKTIGEISAVAKNLMDGLNIKQTLNPRVHELGNKGYLVDFIFCSKGFKLLSLSVPELTVSDHLPVIAELEL